MSWVLSIGLTIGCSVLLSAAGPPLPLESPTVGVFIDFESSPGTPSVRLMEDEAARLLGPAGVALDWRTTKANHGTESFSRVVVLKFKGDCRPGGAIPAIPGVFGDSGEDRTLAWSTVAGGQVLPYGEVECDQVRQALAYLGPGAGKKEKQHAMGLALGRVVAHELYHMLAHTTGHSKKGLAKSTQSLDELISPRDLPFQERDSRAIREGFRGNF